MRRSEATPEDVDRFEHHEGHPLARPPLNRWPSPAEIDGDQGELWRCTACDRPPSGCECGVDKTDETVYADEVSTDEQENG